MHLSPIEHHSGRYGASSRNRPVAFALALATSVLLFATLVAMGSFDAPGGSSAGRLVAISIAGERARPSPQRHAKAQARQVAAAAPVAMARASVVPPIALPSRNTLQLPEGFIQLSRAEMAASDIGKARAAPAAASGNGDDGGSGGSEGNGEGPGGAHLYNAQWLREPRDAELAGYLPANRSPGQWAVIACKTIANYHVEDCRELDEGPRGSGMARALRQAAWQFLVRPPRLDGKPIMGAWVRIRFDFTRAEHGAGEG